MLEYELKFVVPNHHLAPIMEFVNLSCRADSAHPAGIVSSIYFDSLQWDSLNEKINSDYIKTKFRLRWYRDPDSGSYSEASFAESKHRIGCRRVKARVTTDIPPERLDRISLDDASLLDVPVGMRRNGSPTASNLFPSLLIRYTPSQAYRTGNGRQGIN